MAEPTDQNESASATGAPSTERETPAPPPDTTPQADAAEPDVFTREYVEALRTEAAGHRVRAQRADALAERLTTSYAAASGLLADPTDLPFSPDLLAEDGLVDEAKVRAAVESLLVAKPHLRSRRPAGDVGQGARADEGAFSLSGLLRAGAGS